MTHCLLLDWSVTGQIRKALFDAAGRPLLRQYLLEKLRPFNISRIPNNNTQSTNCKSSSNMPIGHEILVYYLFNCASIIITN
jgi:hypothetical protein